MPPSSPLTEQDIWKIAHRTTDIIQSNITRNVCLFGSAACSLWVNIGRVPRDIDIVVSEQFDAEDIKAIVAQADNRYYLEQSKKRGATHQILHCRLPGWKADNGRCVKVDILVPPTLGLPSITESDLYLINDVPVMPVFDLLVMKTQGWWDHRTSPRADFQAKENDDVSDIIALLERARLEDVSYADEANEYRHSQEFMDRAYTLANRFVSVYRTRREWRALHFPL
jgi:hypothetical protein